MGGRSHLIQNDLPEIQFSVLKMIGLRGLVGTTEICRESELLELRWNHNLILLGSNWGRA